jgi:hypothetical protein
MKPVEIKKLNDHQIAVRWSGKKKFQILDMNDDLEKEMVIYLIAYMAGIGR